MGSVCYSPPETNQDPRALREGKQILTKKHPNVYTLKPKNTEKGQTFHYNVDTDVHCWFKLILLKKFQKAEMSVDSRNFTLTSLVFKATGVECLYFLFCFGLVSVKLSCQRHSKDQQNEAIQTLSKRAHP